MTGAKDFIALCSWTMLHEIVVVPCTLNVEKNFAALFFLYRLEITKLLPLIHTDVISLSKFLMRALEKRPNTFFAYLTFLCDAGFVRWVLSQLYRLSMLVLYLW